MRLTDFVILFHFIEWLSIESHKTKSKPISYQLNYSRIKGYVSIETVVLLNYYYLDFSANLKTKVKNKTMNKVII